MSGEATNYFLGTLVVTYLAVNGIESLPVYVHNSSLTIWTGNSNMSAINGTYYSREIISRKNEINNIITFLTNIG